MVLKVNVKENLKTLGMFKITTNRKKITLRGQRNVRYYERILMSFLKRPTFTRNKCSGS